MKRLLTFLFIVVLSFQIQAQINNDPAPSTTTLDVTVLLQGYFDPFTGKMVDSLTTKGLLPKDAGGLQCYGMKHDQQTKWMLINHADTLFVPARFDQGITDWIQLELRNESTGERFSQMGIITTKGRILDTHCRNMRFPTLPWGYYRIIVHHRNHLSIMSADPIWIANYTTAYDFTISISKAYGKEPMAGLNNGKFAMWSCDLSSSSSSGPDDYCDISDWLKLVNDTTAKVTGYTLSDLDGNGRVKEHDIWYYWSNGIRGSYVPYIKDSSSLNIPTVIQKDTTLPQYELRASNFRIVDYNVMRFDIYMRSLSSGTPVHIGADQLIFNVDSNYFNGHLIAILEPGSFIDSTRIRTAGNSQFLIWSLDMNRNDTISSTGNGTKLCTVRLATDNGSFSGSLNAQWRNRRQRPVFSSLLG